MVDRLRDTEKADLILKQIVTRIEELNLCHCKSCDWLNLEPEEHFIDFYFKIDDSHDRNESSEPVPIFDIKKSPFRRLNITDSEHGFNDDMVDKFLCENLGINVDAWVPESEVEYTPVGRWNPINFSKLDFMRIYNIKIPGQSDIEQTEIRKIGNHFYTEVHIDFLNCSQNEHSKRTDDYNKKLARALKTRMLYQAINISEATLGLARSPFDSPMNPNVLNYYRTLSLVEFGDILNNPKKWLEKNEWIDEVTDLSSWGESLFAALHDDLSNALKWFDRCIHSYHANQHLSDENYWRRERDETGNYIAKLKQYAALLRMTSELKSDMLDKTLFALESAMKDLGYLFGTILERLEILLFSTILIYSSFQFIFNLYFIL